MSETAGRGLFQLLIAEVEMDIGSLPDGLEREELQVALVGLRRKLDSLDETE